MNSTQRTPDINAKKYMLQAKDVWVAGNHEGAMQMLIAGRTFYPDDVHIMGLLAGYAYKKQVFPVAEECCRAILAKEPNDAIALYRLGSSLLHSERLEEAQQFLTEGTTFAPQNYMMKLMLGVAHMLAGDYDCAVDVLCKTRRLTANDSGVISMLGLAYHYAGRGADAAQLAEDVQHHKAPTPAMQILQMNALLQPLQNGTADEYDDERAAAMFEGADAVEEKMPHKRFLAAKYFFLKGQEERAATLLQKLVGEQDTQATILFMAAAGAKHPLRGLLAHAWPADDLAKMEDIAAQWREDKTLIPAALQNEHLFRLYGKHTETYRGAPLYVAKPKLGAADVLPLRPTPIAGPVGRICANG